MSAIVLTGSTGNAEIGEPPGIKLKLIGNHPVPSTLPKFALVVWTATPAENVVPSKLVADIAL